MDGIKEKDINFELLESITKLYNTNGKNLERKNGGNNNIVYRCIIRNHEHFIRITPRTTKSKELICGEIDWIQSLFDNGISVSPAIRSINGQYVEELVVMGDYYTVVCFLRSPGRRLSFHVNEEDWNPILFKNWGKITGEIHKITSRYSHPIGHLKRPSGIENLRLKKSLTVIMEQDPDVVHKYYSIKKQIEELSKSNNYGLIHNDNHQGNFNVDHNWKITLFDFDESSHFWFANEIAIPLYDAIMDKCNLEVARSNKTRSRYIHEFYTSFIEGYSKENNLGDSLLEQVPLFLKMRDITRYVMLKDSIYREQLEQHMTDLRITIDNELPFSEII